MADRDALNEIPLGKLVKQLPGLYCAIRDCAYTPTEHLIPVFGGALALVKDNDVFNFYASHCHIRIEMAFGIMVQKWGILQQPLIFCINERFSQGQVAISQDADRGLSVFQEAL